MTTTTDTSALETDGRATVAAQPEAPEMSLGLGGRMRRRLTKLATVFAVALAMLTVGVGGASSASADTIGTSCSEVYYMGESYWAWNDYYGQVIVDLMYSPCVTGTIYSLRGTGYWYVVR